MAEKTRCNNIKINLRKKLLETSLPSNKIKLKLRIYEKYE